MKSRLNKALVMGSLMGILGLVLNLSSPGFDFEENTGLYLLFKFRGAREAPPDVVIVSMDRASLEILNLPPRIDEWPRSLHAALVENLVKEGAGLIAFDVIFEDSKKSDHDILLATAVSRACNVILCESIQNDTFSVAGPSGKLFADLTYNRK